MAVIGMTKKKPTTNDVNGHHMFSYEKFSFPSSVCLILKIACKVQFTTIEHIWFENLTLC